MKTNYQVKVLNLIAFSALLFLLTACPYSSTVPIDTPSIGVSDKLLGKWVEESEFNDNPDYYIFLKKDNNRYTLEEYSYREDEETGESGYEKNNEYIGHITKLGDKEFFNLFKEDESMYYFYWLEFPSTNTFIMHEVTDNITEEFDKSADLKAFFNKHKDLSFFYNRDAKRYNR
ncbi:MAG TPA: hypothetical protein PKC24_13065 [Cyclobacteriaceae bacterium]|nr:hypothetical protein [Cyclobacteriaceae bacterium]